MHLAGRKMTKYRMSEQQMSGQKSPNKKCVRIKRRFRWMKKWFGIGREYILSLLFPPRCPICDEILTPEEREKGIHLACESKLYPVEGAVCMHCGRPLGQISAQKNSRCQNSKHLNNKYPNSKYKNEAQSVQMQQEDAIYHAIDIEENNAYTGVEYLRTESTYEYCRECVKKGYVSETLSKQDRKSMYRGISIKQDRKSMYRGISIKQDGKSMRSSTAIKQGAMFMNNGMLQNGNSASNIVQAKSLYLYKGAIKSSLYRLKYANKREYARFFAEQAVERYGEWLGVDSKEKSMNFEQNEDAGSSGTPMNVRFDVIIPVPMYRPKQKLRGYNQAEVFALELSKKTGIPVDTTCICRIKDTTPQKELSGMERKNNLENAFQKRKSIVQYKHILVVDDIYTTGYTAEAVAKELRKQESCRIELLSICIGGNQ